MMSQQRAAAHQPPAQDYISLRRSISPRAPTLNARGGSRRAGLPAVRCRCRM